MMIILKIAWRNLLRHPGKALIVGGLVLFCVFLMSFVKAIISGMEFGLINNVAHKYTGDIVLVSDKQHSDNVFIDYLGKPVEPIYNFDTVDSALKKISMIKDYVPIGKNMALILTGDGAPGWTYLWGVDLEKYKKCFGNNYEFIEGKGNQLSNGILLPADKRKQINELSNVWYIPVNCSLMVDNIGVKETRDNLDNLIISNEMVLMGLNSGNYASDKAFKVKGIIKYGMINTFLRHFAIVDIQSYRECMGYMPRERKKVSLNNTQAILLNMDDEDFNSLLAGKNIKIDQGKLDLNGSPKDKVDESKGVFNMVFVCLKKNITMERAKDELNKLFKDRKLGIRAISWKSAMQYIGSISTFIKTVLYLFTLFVFAISIFLIINTISMSVLDRTSEIGMMRTIGASKPTIMMMFIFEILILAFISGTLGVLISFGLVGFINNMHLSAKNVMVQIFYGGQYFSPTMIIKDIAMTYSLLLLTAVVSVIYPAKYASDITPVSAVNKK